MNVFEKPKKSLVQLVVVLCFLIPATFITLFQHWEMTHESWQYWFFARILGETGRFVIPDRSPFYVLYLQLFRPLGFPAMVTVEYLVTAIVSSTVLFYFLKKYLPTILAITGVIIWLPYFQISEPSVQKLALAFTLIAIMLREKSNNRLYIAWSYLFFIMSYFCRSSYAVVLGLFLVWDIFFFIKNKQFSSFRLQLRSDWPVLVGIVFIILVTVFQSPHPWNNVWGATTRWFPSDGKSFFKMLQNYNASYIILTYGQYQDHDFYTTNEEVFPGAHNLLSAYLVNPGFMNQVIAEYLKVAVPMATNMTVLPKIFSLPDGDLLFQSLLLILIFLGALAACRSTQMRLFVAATILMFLLTVVHSPKERYLVFLVPLFIISASWYGRQVLFFIVLTLQILRIKSSVLVRFFMGSVSQLMFILLFVGGVSAMNFSGALTADWKTIIETIKSDYKNNNLKYLEFRDTSIYFPVTMGNYKRLTSLKNECQGILSMEHTFLTAFTDVDIERVYDIWEIPPFGKYGDLNTQFNGLVPERINCLFISKNLKYGVGAATNSQIRYENHIEPYAEYLKSNGAKTYQIEGYGEAVIL